MAQFQKARFLSEALKWKANPLHATEQFFGGLRYDNFIFPQARLTFRGYDKRFPAPANKEFAENFAKDLANPIRNREILKIINPETLTLEHETANKQFEAEAATEQQQVAQVTGQPVAQPFSLAVPLPTPVPRTPQVIPQITPKAEAPQVTPAETTLPKEPEVAVAPQIQQPAQPTPVPQVPSTLPPVTQPPSSRPSFQTPRVPASLANAASNLGSNIQIFARNNLDRMVDGLTNMAKGVGRGLAGGASAGLGTASPLLGRAGQGLARGLQGIPLPGGVGARTPGGGRGLTGTPAKKRTEERLLLALFLAIFLFAFISGFSGLTGTTPVGETAPIPSPGTRPPGGCPDTSGNTSDTTCHYLNPAINLFETTIPQSAIDSYTAKYSPIFINAGTGNLAEFTNRLNYIVTNAQQAGLNPALFLGYWKSESNFSTVGARDMGCVGNSFYEQVDCALGINHFTNPSSNPIANCAKSKDANSTACTALKSIRQTWDKTNPISYPIATFDDFAESYGPYADLSGGLHTNCTHTYNELVDVAKELNACTAASPTTPTLGSVLTWDQKIVDNLSTGVWGLFNRLLTAITNDTYSTGVWSGNSISSVYWCTYSVIDAYNLAGISGLSKGSHAAVVNMRQFWQSSQASSLGYKYIDYPSDNTLLKNVLPGYVLFMEATPGTSTGDEHVSMFKVISVNARGDGFVDTNDSNNGQISNRYTVVGWSIKNTPYAIRGIGGI